jgi:hypothetical protein
VKFRNTLILLAVLVALGAYVLLVEVKRTAPQEAQVAGGAAATPLPVVTGFSTGDVRAIRLARPSQDQRTEFAFREDGKWYLTAPVQEEANQTEVVRLIEALATLRPDRAFSETVTQAADYELDPPAITVEVELQDKTVHTLKLGAQNPSQSGYYGQVSGSTRIYLFPYYVGSDIDNYLKEPPLKPTPTVPVTEPPAIPPPPTPKG